ncbi:MAG: ROK family protein [Cytophagales bacterium]|nr:ROK family protein [Cytophagales bacterium]
MKRIGMGIDIGGTSIKYGLVSSEGEIYWESQRPTLAKTTRKEVERNILDAVVETYSMSKKLGVHVEVVGVGTPGLVSEHGVVLGGADNIVDWVDVPLAELIKTRLDVPTYVGNDANMMAIGEFRRSGGLNETVIFFTLGTGIGGAIIIDGQLFLGHFGRGGELGVFPMIINGEIKNWEEVASTSALIRIYQKISGDTNSKVDGKYIVRKYVENNIDAEDAITNWVNFVGMGIAGYINIFNPKKVIVGGGISDSGEFLMYQIREYVRQYAMGECLENVEIIPAVLGNTAGFIGAAIYGLTKKYK